MCSNFSGWPSVSFASKPNSEFAVGLLALICTYSAPIFASCSIYIVLVCHKRRKFKNRIEVDEAQLDEKIEKPAAENVDRESN